MIGLTWILCTELTSCLKEIGRKLRNTMLPSLTKRVVICPWKSWKSNIIKLCFISLYLHLHGNIHVCNNLFHVFHIWHMFALSFKTILNCNFYCNFIVTEKLRKGSVKLKYCYCMLLLLLCHMFHMFYHMFAFSIARCVTCVTLCICLHSHLKLVSYVSLMFYDMFSNKGPMFHMFFICVTCFSHVWQKKKTFVKTFCIFKVYIFHM